MSVINTTHNVSEKLCQSAADILRSLSNSVSGLEADPDTSLTLETVTYLLEDRNMISSNRNKMSSELAGGCSILYCANRLQLNIIHSGTLKNLKKLEQALDILNKVLQPDME